MSRDKEDTATVNGDSLYFTTIDYIMLLLVLVISFLFGLYSAIFKRKSTIEEYVLGNRQLKTIPVSMSLVASLISGLTIIGLPSEIYFHGSGYLVGLPSLIIAHIIFYFGYLPVFYKMKITSLYEYLEKRFDNRVRVICITFYILSSISWMTIVLCLSSLTLTQVSGINFSAIVIVSGVLITFYTSVGGIKTVVWTDVVQTVFMVTGVGILTVKGTIDSGGLIKLWERNRMYGRLDVPRFTIDFFEKYSFWEMMIGHTILILVHTGLNQGSVQRCISVPTLKDARNCIILSCLGMCIFIGLSVYNGLLLFATFYDCDPLTSQKIKARDQLIPLLTMKVLSNFPGLPGLFVAALSSATLSTLSTILNSLAAVILQDFYKPFFNTNSSEHCSHVVMKLSVVVLGLLSTGLVFVVVKVGSIVQVVHSLLGAANGPILAIFTIGIFIPFVKSKAAIIASVIAFLVSSWIIIGAIMAAWSGEHIFKTKPLLTYDCDSNITVKNATSTNGNVFFLYKISQLWYSVIGFMVTVVLATILSAFMEKNNVKTIDHNLLSPIICRFIKEERTTPGIDVPLLNQVTGKSAINE